VSRYILFRKSYLKHLKYHIIVSWNTLYVTLRGSRYKGAFCVDAMKKLAIQLQKCLLDILHNKYVDVSRLSAALFRSRDDVAAGWYQFILVDITCPGGSVSVTHCTNLVDIRAVGHDIHDCTLPVPISAYIIRRGKVVDEKRVAPRCKCEFSQTSIR